MNKILLHTGGMPATTSISNTFIEKYMIPANGSYVKIYLYLAKCFQTNNETITISSLADKMENTENDIIRALQYWEKNNLLRIYRNPLSDDIEGIEMLIPEQDITANNIDEALSASEYNEEITEPEEITPDDYTEPEKESQVEEAGKYLEISVTPEQTKRLSSNEDFTWTCRVIESYLNRPLNINEAQLITYLYDTLRFSKDLLLYLYEYCISMGKTNNNYIQAVALSWDEQNIKTPEDAKMASINYNAGYTAIAKACALGRSLAAVEKKFVDRWQKESHMDLSVILEACNRTLLKLQKADFKYIDGILDKWHSLNVKTLVDIEKADEIYSKNKAENQNKDYSNSNQTQQTVKKNQFNTFQQRNASNSEVDALEKKLLSN